MYFSLYSGQTYAPTAKAVTVEESDSDEVGSDLNENDDNPSSSITSPESSLHSRIQQNLQSTKNRNSEFVR